MQVNTHKHVVEKWGITCNDLIDALLVIFLLISLEDFIVDLHGVVPPLIQSLNTSLLCFDTSNIKLIGCKNVFSEYSFE